MLQLREARLDEAFCTRSRSIRVRTNASRQVREEITFARIELEGFRPDELDLEGIAGFAAGFGERGTAVDCGNA